MSETIPLVPFTALADPVLNTHIPNDVECTFIGMDDVSEDGRVVTHRQRNSRKSAGYTSFRNNDVLFAKITPCMENGKGALAESLMAGVGFGSTEFHVLRATGNADPRFVYQWTKSPEFRAQAEALMSGSAGQRRVPRSFFSLFEVPLLPLAEQRRIAEILDTVDENIRSTERLIAKLKQVRLGVVRNLLSGNSRTEESRLSPSEGWRNSSVGSEFEVKPGITLGQHRVPRHNPFPYLRVANVHRGEIDSSDIAYVEEFSGDSYKYSIQEGDLLVVEGHANSSEIGRCARVGEATRGMFFQNHLFRLRARSMCSRFAELWLNSEIVRKYWRRVSATSSGLYTINYNALRGAPVAVPSIEVQQRIVAHSESHVAALAGEVNRLTKLRELKRGLMADLLTGKVRVNVEDAL